MKRLLALLLAIFALTLVACTAAPTVGDQAAGAAPAPLAPPAGALAYLVSPPGEHLATTTLSLVDTADWSLRRSVELPLTRVENIARDPQGRLWVGLWRNQEELDDRVQIYSPEGELLHEIHPCVSPSAGISFAAGRALIACAERGFGGSVAAIDLATLETVGTVTLRRGDEIMLLMASAAVEDKLVVASSISDPADGSQAMLTIIDARTMSVRAELDPGPNTNLVQALTHGSRVYLLNAASWRQPRGSANDLLVLDLDGEPTLKPLALAPSPAWGAIDGATLYAFHDPTWNQLNGDPSRQISRLDLNTGAVETWPLPDNWHAGSLAVVEGGLLLSHWDSQETAADGLYRFDLRAGSLSHVFQVANATRLLVTPP